jgi:hypothetical protein
MTFEFIPARAAAVGHCVPAMLAQPINVRDPAEISRLSRELGITWLQLLRIIDRVGTDLRAVRSAVLDQHGVTWH